VGCASVVNATVFEMFSAYPAAAKCRTSHQAIHCASSLVFAKIKTTSAKHKSSKRNTSSRYFFLLFEPQKSLTLGLLYWAVPRQWTKRWPFLSGGSKLLNEGLGGGWAQGVFLSMGCTVF